MLGAENPISTQRDRWRGLPALSLLLICFSCPQAGAQHAPMEFKVAQAAARTPRVVTIGIGKFKPSEGVQHYGRLDSNGANELVAAVEKAAGTKGDLKLGAITVEDVNEILVMKGRMEQLAAFSEKSTTKIPEVSRFEYFISTTYTNLDQPAKHFRANARLIQVDPLLPIASAEADFDTSDPDPTSKLGWDLVTELRRHLQLPVPSHKLLVPCFRIEGQGNSPDAELRLARKLARNFASDALTGFQLIKLLVPSEESACGEKPGVESGEHAELYLVGTITVVPSKDSSGQAVSLYYFHLAVFRGPLEEEVMESVDSPGCKGLDPLLETARDWGHKLRQKLEGPAFQRKLEEN